MNWYIKIKLAQVWQTDQEEGVSFKEDLANLYELEYKYNTLKKYPFKGHDRRKENILSKLEQKLSYLISKIKKVLIKLFEGWLSQHALTDPDAWAESRLYNSYFSDLEEYMYESGSSPVDIFHSVVDNYKRLQNNNQLWFNTFQKINWRQASLEILKEIESNISSYPTMKNFLEFLGNERKEYMLEELNQDGLDEFNNMYNKNFSSQEEAEKFIQDASVSDLGYNLLDFWDFYDDNFWNLAHEHGFLEGILTEINRNLVFPVWYQYWSSQGIEETRETIENVYSMLIKSNSINDSITAINIALNTVHQNGTILEYLEEYGVTEDYDVNDIGITEGDLSELSDRDVGEWNQQLRTVGVEI